MSVTISLCDQLNPGFGYSLRIERDGQTLLFTSVRPDTGGDLTYSDCLEVAGWYAP